MIDDSALFHARAYDPVKAREYYLRTRKLKGRSAKSKTESGSGREGKRPPEAVVSGGKKANRSDTQRRRAELKARKEALEKRLDRLREVLKQLVAEAKGRSGVKKKDSKDTAPETKIDKADRNKAEKDRKPLTAKQKADKAKKAKEAYEKEHPNTLSQDVEILEAQVKDIQAKIQKAVAEARERRNKAGKDDKASGSKSKSKPNDGPRGR